MKPRLFATATCLIVPVGLFWLWVKQPSFTESTSKKSSPSSAKHWLAEASITPAATEPPQVSDRADPQKLFEAVEATNVPINLWGRVIDEDARPVGGVVIDYDYSIEHGNLHGVAWSDQEVRAGQATTDQGGLFSVRGLQGQTGVALI